MKSLKTMFYNWVYRDAEWWQFWRPQRGGVGGTIMGVVLFIIILLTVTVVFG